MKDTHQTILDELIREVNRCPSQRLRECVVALTKGYSPDDSLVALFVVHNCDDVTALPEKY